jgi:hypothetical protein
MKAAEKGKKDDKTTSEKGTASDDQEPVSPPEFLLSGCDEKEREKRVEEVARLLGEERLEERVSISVKLIQESQVRRGEGSLTTTTEGQVTPLRENDALKELGVRPGRDEWETLLIKFLVHYKSVNKKLGQKEDSISAAASAECQEWVLYLLFNSTSWQKLDEKGTMKYQGLHFSKHTMAAIINKMVDESGAPAIDPFANDESDALKLRLLFELLLESEQFQAQFNPQRADREKREKSS